MCNQRTIRAQIPFELLESLRPPAKTFVREDAHIGGPLCLGRCRADNRTGGLIRHDIDAVANERPDGLPRTVRLRDATPSVVSARAPVIGSPPTAMRPAVTASRPPSIISRVLLPQPDGPRTATNCPRGKVKLRELAASIASAVPAR